MRMLQAIWDSGGEPRNGSFWVIRPAEVPGHLLESLYYDFLAKTKPQDPAALDQGDVAAGIVAINPEWLACYRFCHGGRDRLGRPGRYLVACLLGPRSEMVNLFLEGFPDLSLWSGLRTQLQAGALPQETTVDVRTAFWTDFAPETRIVPEMRMPWKSGGANAWEHAFQRIRHLDNLPSWHCQLSRAAGVDHSEISVTNAQVRPTEAAAGRATAERHLPQTNQCSPLRTALNSRRSRVSLRLIAGGWLIALLAATWWWATVAFLVGVSEPSTSQPSGELKNHQSLVPGSLQFQAKSAVPIPRDVDRALSLEPIDSSVLNRARSIGIWLCAGWLVAGVLVGLFYREIFLRRGSQQ